MEITYHGGHCVRLTTKKRSFVCNDNLSQLGRKQTVKPGEVLIGTNQDTGGPSSLKDIFLIDSPGEFEMASITVIGTQVRAHTDEHGKKSAVMYRVVSDDLRVGIIPHMHPDITEAELERLGIVDVLVIPVGGNGYTLDAVGAVSIIKKVEPKVVIPTHYAEDGVAYEVPQQPLETFLQAMGINDFVSQPSFKLKDLAEATDKVTVCVLSSH